MSINVANVQRRFNELQAENHAMAKRLREMQGEKEAVAKAEREIARKPLVDEIRDLKAQLTRERQRGRALEKEIERVRSEHKKLQGDSTRELRKEFRGGVTKALKKLRDQRDHLMQQLLKYSAALDQLTTQIDPETHESQ